MSTALAEREPAAISVTTDQLDLIKRTVASGATDAELKLFLFDCARRGVHPLDKLLHFTKRGGKYTPVTSIDFMRSQAAMSGEMAGSDDARFFPDYETGNNPPDAATVTVYRMTQGQRFAYTATARWAEYCPDNAPMWRRMPHTMLGKCAEALALRKAFPQQLAGLYSREEMDQADSTGAVASVTEASGRRAGAEKNGAEQRSDVASAPPPNVNAETGEELSTPPPGYFYVQGYQLKNGWHEAYLLNYDAQGGALRVSTKTQVGFLLNDAEQNGVPVSVDVTMKKNGKGEAYVNKCSLLKPEQDENNGHDHVDDTEDFPF